MVTAGPEHAACRPPWKPSPKVEGVRTVTALGHMQTRYNRPAKCHHGSSSHLSERQGAWPLRHGQKESDHLVSDAQHMLVPRHNPGPSFCFSPLGHQPASCAVMHSMAPSPSSAL